MNKIKKVFITSLLFSLVFIICFSFFSIEYSDIKSPNSIDLIQNLDISVHKNLDQKDSLPYPSNNITSNISSMPTHFIEVDPLKSQASTPFNDIIATPIARNNEQTSIDLPNSLHLYQWFQFCQNSLPILKSWPLFPNFPFSRRTISALSVSVESPNSVHRIFGFLIPPADGIYAFACNQIQSLELWISTDESAANLKQISIKHIQRNKLENSSVNSEDTRVHLGKDHHHYIEFYFSVNNNILLNKVSLFWIIPGSEHFSSIDKKYIGATSNQAEQSSPTPNPPYPPYVDVYTLPNIVNRKNYFITLPYLTLDGIDDLYDDCEYKPSFAYHRIVKKYKGVEMIAPMILSVFPDDLTSFNGQVKDFNPIIPQVEANTVLAAHTKIMQKKWPNITSVKLVNLEVQRDHENGNRYLIDTEVKLKKENMFRFSQFIFSPKSKPSYFCMPKGFKYKTKVFVHIALSLKNQGHWFQYFIDNVERIYRETKDEYFGIIVIDFDSQDVNAEEIVKKSLIPNKVFVGMKGRYERASSLNKALEQVQNEDDIVYTCDLHMELPNDIIESIRQHTIQGFSGYAPIVFRLECGHTYMNIGGFWEGVGYGLFSMYKSDWNKVGAFDSETFKDKWGGEDWDLVDRFISRGYFMDRKKQSHMLHFYHDRSRLW